MYVLQPSRLVYGFAGRNLLRREYFPTVFNVDHVGISGSDLGPKRMAI